MKKHKYAFTIRQLEMAKIISGEKRHEYRDSTEFYHKKFCTFNEELNKYVLKTAEEISPIMMHDIHGNFVLIEVTRLRHVKFEDKLAEDFQKGDIAYVLDIGKVIDYKFG